MKNGVTPRWRRAFRDSSGTCREGTSSMAFPFCMSEQLAIRENASREQRSTGIWGCCRNCGCCGSLASLQKYVSRTSFLPMTAGGSGSPFSSDALRCFQQRMKIELCASEGQDRLFSSLYRQFFLLAGPQGRIVLSVRQAEG